MSTTKKCPMCAEQIPLAAVTCEYCRAQFEVTSTGYCQTCHDVREADGNGKCKICGNAVVDLRVESRLIEESVEVPLPISPPAQAKKTKTEKSQLPIGILAGILILAVISAALWFGQNSLFATLAPTATITFTPSPTLTSTPTMTSTRTPRPTPTVTPPPSWVTEFAQPILDVIAIRSPDFQDDFGIGSASWKEEYCPGSMKYIDGELVFTNCRIYRSNIDWHDFVVEFDIRYVEGATPSSYFSFQFRDLGSSGHSLRIDQNGDVLIGFENQDGAWFRGAHPANQMNHVLLIAKGDEFAFYLNGKPLYHTHNDAFLFGKCVFYAERSSKNDQAILAIDNFMIWDISDLP